MESYDGAEAIERAWRDGLTPDPLLTVSEWADRYRVLSQRASSEPGRWRTERTPYLKETNGRENRNFTKRKAVIHQFPATVVLRYDGSRTSAGECGLRNKAGGVDHESHTEAKNHS
jgi:hypothetical protein